jgi:hypothetical protein
MTKAKTKSQDMAADVAALLRARHPLLWIITREESRVEGYLAEACFAAGYVPRMWDVAQGFTGLDGNPLPDADLVRDPGEALHAIARCAREDYGQSRSTTYGSRALPPWLSGPERTVWVMRDLPPWLSGPAGMTTLRQLRNLARMLPGVAHDQAQALVIVSPSGDIPAELANHATVIEWPLPDRHERLSLHIARGTDMLTITLDTNNAAFDDNVPQETARILRALADQIESGVGSERDRGSLLDINGNPVGLWDWTTA